MKRAVALLALACQPRWPSAEHPICDGVADDTRALQRALDRGGRLALPASRICRATQLTIATPIELDLAGSTLQATGAGPFLRVTADRVALRNGTIDGSHARGWLVDWHGKAGALDAIALQHGEAIGLSVSAGDVTARRSVARSFAGDLGIGFRVGAGALITDDAIAENCRYAGFFLSQTTDPATSLDASTARNGIGVAIEGQRGGRIARLHSRDDDRFGLLLDHGASDWRIDHAHIEATGRTARNPSGTGVELFAHNHRNLFGNVTVAGAAGYGLAIAGGSNDNAFTRVTLDARGAWDGDPGLVIAGGSQRNRLGDVRVLGHTVGIRIGENDLATDAPNNGNRIATAYIEGARYNAIRVERGDDNAIDHAIIADSDSSGSDAQGFMGLVYFGNDASNNHIGTVIQADAHRVPNYIVYAGPCAVATCLRDATPRNNRVDRITARRWSVARDRGVTAAAE